ncbi:MAG TPA: peptidoglycan-binding domain-containing protein [Stellaceae bacterium]|nr:peptidoglycan-binding domain-containing protein [Stellaceae bacterium]
MTRIGLIAALALAGATLGPPAMAQTAPPLTYAQSLSPQATREVQESLRRLGFYRGAADGVWGRDSSAALERFQQSHGLQVTGQLNDATVKTLGLAPGDLVAMGPPAPPVSQTAMQPLNRDVVRMIQARLNRFGFYRGPDDGVLGPNTTAAIERFQQSRDLRATGQLDPTTITALGFNPNNLMAQSGTVYSGSSTPR